MGVLIAVVLGCWTKARLVGVGVKMVKTLEAAVLMR